MLPTSIFTRRLAIVGGLLACVAGCQQQAKGPQLDPAGLPRAVHSLEKSVRSILEACEVGDVSGAHRPLHSVGKQISSVDLLLGAAGVGAENQQAAEKTLQRLEEGLNNIDAAMHESTEPEFDERMIADLRETLDSLRNYLPESVVAELEQLDERAAERMAKAAEAAEQAEAEGQPEAEAEAEADPAEPEESAADEAEAATAEADEEVAADEGPALSP